MCCLIVGPLDSATIQTSSTIFWTTGRTPPFKFIKDRRLVYGLKQWSARWPLCWPSLSWYFLLRVPTVHLFSQELLLTKHFPSILTARPDVEIYVDGSRCMIDGIWYRPNDTVVVLDAVDGKYQAKYLFLAEDEVKSMGSRNNTPWRLCSPFLPSTHYPTR